jgi:molybdenum cofactor biosynthesis enzyme
MCKAVDKDIQINNIRLLHNTGGKVVYSAPSSIKEEEFSFLK